MKFLFWIVIALFAAALSLFAVANRESVALGLWPLPFVLDLPLYATVLAAVILGFIAGAMAACAAGRRWRRETRRRGRRITALERELAATQARLADSAEKPLAEKPLAEKPPAALALRG